MLLKIDGKNIIFQITIWKKNTSYWIVSCSKLSATHESRKISFLLRPFRGVFSSRSVFYFLSFFFISWQMYMYTLQFYKVHKRRKQEKKIEKMKEKKREKCYTFCVEVFSTLRPICFYMFSLFKKLKLFRLTSFRRRNRHSLATKNILSNNLLKENLIQPNSKLFRRI